MLILISYDISTETAAGRKRLRHVAKICQNFGQRVQFSVFECEIDHAQWQQVRSQLLAEIDLQEDSLRLYLLGNNWQGRKEHHGRKRSFDIGEEALLL